MRTVSAIIFVMISAPALAQETSCESVYQNAVRNITVDTIDRSSRSFYFNLYCERDGSTRSIAAGTNFSFPIEGIPFEAGGDASWDEAELKEFCRIGSDSNYYEASDFSYGSFVVTDALTSYNQCLFLQKENLLVTHQEAPAASFIVFGEFTSPILDATIDTVQYDPDKLTCTSTSFSDDGSEELIDGSRRYDPNRQPFSIACVRKAFQSGDKDYYPRTWFQMATSVGPYTVILPGDSHLGFNLASQAEAAYNAAIESRNAAREEARRAVAAAARRIETLEPVVLTGYAGDSWMHHTKDISVACYDHEAKPLEDRMREKCPTGYRATTYTKAGSVDGGRCGQTWATLVCLPNQ